MAKRSIKLPMLFVESKKFSFGRISHLLRPEETAKVQSTFEVQISPRRKTQALILDNGETVVVTTVRKIDRPDGVDGLLFEHKDGTLQWLSHKLLDQFFRKYGNEPDWSKRKADIERSWENAFWYRTELRSSCGDVVSPGLRPPQIGALHSIGAHWAINDKPATIVMPTGTGKTETMLAALINFVRETLLVIVPSKALRDQTAHKFRTLGLLRELQALATSAANPIVAVIEHRVKDPAEFEFLKACNVLIATINTVAQGEAASVADQFASICSHVVFDEAHHVPANSYSEFRDHAKEKRILQYTATPFRRDGKNLEGKTIFSYPLGQAQKDGYFRKIKFKAVFELRDDVADKLVAKTGIAQLRNDLNAGLDHLLMARCKNAKRAKEVFDIYKELAPDLNPVLIFSEDPRDNKANIKTLRSRTSKIVVCVYMLGEGFDLPELKVAAIHDTHKSIAILLQFAGRFTRDAGPRVGEATVIANVANQSISSALEHLYDEDADWNKLLSEMSSEHIRNYTDVVDFIRESRRIDPEREDDRAALPITPSNMRPSFNAWAFRAKSFTPEKFIEAMRKGVEIHGAWINEKRSVLFFVTEQHQRTQWTQSTSIRDRQWDLYIAYYNKQHQTLFIHCSDNDAPLLDLSSSISSGASPFTGDEPFRVMADIQRLIFQNIGLKKPGRRNLRYSMYSGADVVNALSEAEKSTSVKANASATGFEKGEPVTIACSAKGKVWSRDRGRVPELLDWCDQMAIKLNDSRIDVDKIIANLLIPELVTTLPRVQVFCIDWPTEFTSYAEHSTKFTGPSGENSISQYSINFVDPTDTSKHIDFLVSRESEQSTFRLSLTTTDRGFQVKQTGGPNLSVTKGKLTLRLDDYLSEYPPNVLYVDGSELDGCYHVKPSNRAISTFPAEKLEVWDWTGVSINVESMWHNGVQRSDSVQEFTANKFSPSFDIVFDDDDDGEAADLVLLKEHKDEIELALVHCKFSGAATPGARVKDMVEVSSQAVRSSKRVWKFDELITHLFDREKRVLRGRQSRFLKGTPRELAAFRKLSRYKNVRTRIIMVQPGLSQSKFTADQSLVISGAEAHLLQTLGVGVEVICSP